MTSPFNHSPLSIAYTTPDGRTRSASVPAEPVRLGPDDQIGALSAMVIALNDRVERLETLVRDVIVVMQPMLDAVKPASEPGETEWPEVKNFFGAEPAAETFTPEAQFDLFEAADARAPVDTLDV